MTAHSAVFPSPCPTDNPLSPVTLAKGGSTEMQKFSQIEKSYVDEARRMARHLIATEAAGPGDIVNAMQRIEARYGVPFSLLKSLRYRTPKDIYMGAWVQAGLCLSGPMRAAGSPPECRARTRQDIEGCD